MLQFTESISFVVRCDSQQEVDEYWAKLSAGGSEDNAAGSRTNSASPGRLCLRGFRLLKHPKAMQAMMGMKKLDLAELERAAQS